MCRLGGRLFIRFGDGIQLGSFLVPMDGRHVKVGAVEGRSDEQMSPRVEGSLRIYPLGCGMRCGADSVSHEPPLFANP